MPSYYRRRNYNRYWSGNRISRWTRYSSRTTRSSRRRAIGNLIASNAQKDNAVVNISIPHRCAARFELFTQNNNTHALGVYAVNVWDLLRKSEFYKSYSNMFDQVKIDSVKVKVTPVQWTFNQVNGNNQINQALTIVTAWDRTGLSQKQTWTRQDNYAATRPQIGTEANNDGLYITIGKDIATYSSAITKNLNPGGSVNFSRYLYPSTMSEKSCYVNTSDLKEWYQGYDYKLSRYWGMSSPLFVQNSNLNDSAFVETNPCVIFEDSKIPFKPTFLLGVLGGISNQNQSDLNREDCDVPPVIFNAEFDIGVTFRGLRKAAIVT